MGYFTQPLHKEDPDADGPPPITHIERGIKRFLYTNIAYPSILIFEKKISVLRLLGQKMSSISFSSFEHFPNISSKQPFNRNLNPNTPYLKEEEKYFTFFYGGAKNLLENPWHLKRITARFCMEIFWLKQKQSKSVLYWLSQKFSERG